jgi:hypothetical protein
MLVRALAAEAALAFSLVVFDTAAGLMQKWEILSLEEKIAPRDLTAAQQREISSALLSLPFIGYKVEVVSYALDADAAQLGVKIIDSLSQAQLAPHRNLLSVMPLGSLALGIWVTGASADDDDLVAALRHAFKDIGHLDVSPDPFPSTGGGSISNSRDAGAAITIFIGAKPLPK